MRKLPQAGADDAQGHRCQAIRAWRDPEVCVNRRAIERGDPSDDAPLHRPCVLPINMESAHD
jgi:hypothetical protein